MMNTIAATTTATGLAVTAVLDDRPIPTGGQVSDEQMRDLEDRGLTRTPSTATGTTPSRWRPGPHRPGRPPRPPGAAAPPP